MSKKGLIILTGSFLIVVAIVATGLFVLWNRVSVSVPVISETEEISKQAAEEKSGLGPKKKAVYPLETFVVNLADPGGKRYLRVKMALELDNQALSDEIKGNMPKIRDKVLMILPAKAFKDIQTVEGKNSLRNEIIVGLNFLLEKGKVTNIYFQEFVVQ